MKSIFTQLFLFISFTVFAGGDTTGYEIKVTIKNLKEGSKCFLANYFHGAQYKQDSAICNAKGEIIFKGKNKFDQGIFLLFTPDIKKHFDFVMDAGQHFSMETDTTDYVKLMKVKGSQENKLFFEHQHYILKKQKEFEPIRELQKKTSPKNKDSVKLVKEKIDAFNNEVKLYVTDFIKKNQGTFVSNYLKIGEDLEVP